MPIKVLTLNDFSGGLNNSASPRDLAPNEFAHLGNVSAMHSGKLIPGYVFKPNFTSDKGSVVDGYNMFVFSNDYKISDNSGGYTGYYIALADNGDLDIYQSDNTTWYDNRLTGIASATPAFISAEGDLFVSGDHSTTPKSYVYLNSKRFKLADGSASASSLDVAGWYTDDQAKPVPSNDDMQCNWGRKAGPADQDVDTDLSIVQNELIWLIAWGDSNSGSFSNTAVPGNGEHIQFAASWLYKNKAESKLFEFTAQTYAAENLDDGKDAVDRAIKVTACIGRNDDSTKDWSASSNGAYQHGARLYSKLSTETEWYLLAEVDFERGIQAEGETDYNSWQNDVYGAAIAASTGFIQDPPSVYSYYALNGHIQAEVPSVGTSVDRKVYWKTGVVANGRAYVGNVKINDQYYGDRIFKSPPYQYDIFTTGSWIESTTNDGDEIIALATYADRILMFKKNSVTIINVSRTEEYVETSQTGSGVHWPAAVNTSQFGVSWANSNGCFLYDGEKITNLLYKKGETGRSRRVSQENWALTVTNPVVGVHEETAQLVVMFNAADAASAHIYSFNNGSWTQTDTICTSDISNMVNLPTGELLVHGGAANDDINKFTTRADASSIAVLSVETSELHFGNYESTKNIHKLRFTYNSGAAGSTSVVVTASVNGGAYGSTLGTLAGTGRQLVEIDLRGNATFQKIKTLQIKLLGNINVDFELDDISIIYREIGAR